MTRPRPFRGASRSHVTESLPIPIQRGAVALTSPGLPNYSTGPRGLPSRTHAATGRRYIGPPTATLPVAPSTRPLHRAPTPDLRPCVVEHAGHGFVPTNRASDMAWMRSLSSSGHQVSEELFHLDLQRTFFAVIVDGKIGLRMVKPCRGLRIDPLLCGFGAQPVALL